MASIEADRFWAKVRKGDGCWEWTGHRDPNGYGRIGRGKLAHRASWELVRGRIPRGVGYHGICVLHLCDNRACVRPDHLRLGTQLENMADMVAKGRSDTVRGVDHPIAKLDDDAVRAIRCRRMAGEKLKSLSAAFGVSETRISLIARGIGWPHITN